MSTEKPRPNVEAASAREIGSAHVTAYCLHCPYKAAARSGDAAFEHLKAHQAYAAVHLAGHK